jgi:hypothetical protein
MTRSLVMALMLPAAASFVQEPKESPAPPFLVDITCRTQGLDPEVVKAFRERIKQISVYAKEINPGAKRTDKEGNELWSFEVAGESKFDPTLFQRAFTDIPCKKFQLTFTGTATQDPQTKVIFVTSAKGTAKVKLMNARRDAFKPEEEVDDIVSRVSASITKGHKEFTVKGEIFSHGGTLAVLLESFSPGAALVEDKEKPALHPPYGVTVLAKSRFAQGKQGYIDLLAKIEKLKPRIRMISHSPVPDDNAGWEE